MKKPIHISNLGFAYSKQRIISGLGFTLEKEEKLAVLGPSGCGKSTLLRLINHLLTPCEGSISVNGRASLLFQDDRLLPWRTCIENVRLALSHAKLSQQQATDKITSLFGKLKIPDVQNRYPSSLSGGMRQRVALARALINNPDILLLDEPFAAVDHLTRQALILELHHLQQRSPSAMLLVTHNIDEALFLCDRIIILGPSPASVQHFIDVPKLPSNWQSFYQSKAVTDIKVDILNILEGMQS